MHALVWIREVLWPQQRCVAALVSGGAVHSQLGLCPLRTPVWNRRPRVRQASRRRAAPRKSKSGDAKGSVTMKDVMMSAWQARLGSELGAP